MFVGLSLGLSLFRACPELIRLKRQRRRRAYRHCDNLLHHYHACMIIPACVIASLPCPALGGFRTCDRDSKDRILLERRCRSGQAAWVTPAGCMYRLLLEAVSASLVAIYRPPEGPRNAATMADRWRYWQARALCLPKASPVFQKRKEQDGTTCRRYFAKADFAARSFSTQGMHHGLATLEYNLNAALRASQQQ